ncbi:GIY-YIG nuclease family protein [Paenibacillus hodogayensis]|uniref:GIY-YIG nuclease family protein n=1 Tax=Paenibacillus hodogayensis TaxID=279208 RepID=A0ABV5W840_9BACL
MSDFYFKAERYPEEPGCYLMFDRSGRLLYVGKAVNLRKRLSSYFHGKPDREKTARLVAEIDDIEIMIVRNENESLTLETNLIQYYLPPYNRAKKREQSVYAYIAATEEGLPRLLAADRERQESQVNVRQQSKSALLGPYPNPVFRNYALDFVIEHYRLRTCEPLESRLCMRYYLDKCGGICEEKETGKQYGERLEEALSVLSDPRRVTEAMQDGIERLSERLLFERAKELHTRRKALQSMLEEQAVNRQRDYSQLVVYFGNAYLLAAQFEYGMLRTRFVWLAMGEGLEQEVQETLFALLPDAGEAELVTNDRERTDSIVRLACQRGRKVKVVLPVKGAKRHLLQLCERNYRYRLTIESS